MQLTETTAAPNSPPAASVRPGTRLSSIDIFRGLIMIWMALDHTRDFFTNLSFEPETLSQTNLVLFATRWITHFCAPMFFFLAGTGAFLYGQRKSQPPTPAFSGRHFPVFPTSSMVVVDCQTLETPCKAEKSWVITVGDILSKLSGRVPSSHFFSIQYLQQLN